MDPPNLSRPLRTAGMALLALAALCLVVGTVSLVGGGSPRQTASPSVTGSTRPAAPGSASPTTEEPSVTSQPTVTAAPSQSQVVGASSKSQAARSAPVRIYNNSMIHGLAVRAADDLRNAGWNVADVGNYPYGVIATTTVYFRKGTDEEGQAAQLAAMFQMRAEPRFEGIANAPPGVILIVTNDYGGLRTK